MLKIIVIALFISYSYLKETCTTCMVADKCWVNKACVTGTNCKNGLVSTSKTGESSRCAYTAKALKFYTNSLSQELSVKASERYVGFVYVFRYSKGTPFPKPSLKIGSLSEYKAKRAAKVAATTTAVKATKSTFDTLKFTVTKELACYTTARK